MDAYHHKEAYCLMEYRCKACGISEILWNSRDGVTPLYIASRCCGGEAVHVNWQNDQCVPGFQPPLGSRVFRDISPLEAGEAMRQRIEFMRGQYPISDADVERLVAQAEEAAREQPGAPCVREVAS